MTLPIALGLLTILIWLAIAFGRASFWTITDKLLHAELSSGPRRVAVVIPARNEAESIGKTIESLLGQVVTGEIHIFVVDDESSDDTAHIAREAAARHAAGDRLTVISSKPLPEGWTGKLWAVSQGIAAASEWNPDYFLHTDADILHGRDNVAQLIAVAERNGYDLTSVMVKLHCEGSAERLLIPAFVYFFLLLYPPRWVQSSRMKTAGAAGGCMLVRPMALQRAGGIESIRNQIIDDCALARRIKSSGGRVWLGLTNDTQSHRVYEDFGEVEQMISRTAFNQLRHSSLMLVGTVLGMACTFLLPPALVLGGAWCRESLLVVILGGIAWLLMTLTYLPMIRFYNRNPAAALTLPIAAAFYSGATIHSAWKHWNGRGGEWKGRAQDH